MQSFFSFSPQFYKYQNYIIAIYLLAVLDIATTLFNIHLGLSEINIIGQSLLHSPFLLILWRFGFLTVLMIFPYWISTRTHESKAIELSTYCFWWVLIFLSALPVLYNLFLGLNELNLIFIHSLHNPHLIAL